MPRKKSASRFSVVTHPARQPANDIVTGTTVGPFIDTGRELRFQDKGRVYLAVSTVKEMAEVAELSSGISEERLAREVREAYENGYADALKEIDLEHFDILADRLGRILATRGDRTGSVDSPDDSENVEGVAESGGDSTVEPVGDDEASREQGRASVPSGKSNGLPDFKL